MADLDELESPFDDAADFVAASVASGSKTFDNQDLLSFYGLYKQATAGECNTPKPGFWDFGGVAKWDAWRKLGNISRQDAMQAYVQLLSQKAPGWAESSSARNKQAGPTGPVFSSLKGEADVQVDVSKLWEVAGLGDVDAVSRLLAAGASIDATDEDGCTALHFAADRGHTDVARLLISRGATINCCDAEHQTPLHYAAICEHEEVCRVLLEAGADPSLKDDSRLSPAEAGPSHWNFWPQG